MSNYNPADLDALDAQEATEKKEMAYTKAQILTSVRYSDRRDALNVVLKEGRHYTDAEIKKALRDYYGKKVK